MFGAAGKISLTSSAYGISVTQGIFGANHGFWDTNMGSVNPTTIAGIHIDRLLHTTQSPGFFALVLEGEYLNENLFYSITPEGDIELLRTAADNHFLSGGDTYWYWNRTRPAEWDGSGVVTVFVKEL